MSAAKSFDVFLSHNSKDKPAVRELAEALRARRLKVWLDEKELRPGLPWQKALEGAIESIRSAAVLVGKDGVGPWEDQEMAAFLRRFVGRAAQSVIPVLLPGAPEKVRLPLLLEGFTWVDLRGGLTPVGLDRLVWGITGKKPRTRTREATAPVPVAEADPPDPALAAYCSWARERYRGLSLIGLGAADLRIGFEEVYVPLRIAHRHGLPKMEGMAGKRPGRAGAPPADPGSDEIEVEGIFATGSPHALILGHPGAGKTTALLKLLHVALIALAAPAEGPPPPAGLAVGTVPVLLRLRRLSAGDLDRPLADFIERELAELSGGTLPAGIGPLLWERGLLLLLLDGLDEIADEGMRARVCGWLDWALDGVGRRHVRAVVSCRFAGYGGKTGHGDGPPREVRFGEHVLPLELRPLGAEQCRQLVRRWFREARRAVRDYSEAAAHRDAGKLIDALDAPAYGAQSWKVLIGSPLLLTLLCVIVLRGGQMPRQRVAFYDQSLRVLLAQWSKGRRGDESEPPGEPPLDVETALTVLGSLAWRLHSAHRRNDLSLAELADHVEECLETRGALATKGLEIAGWLHREAGVLIEDPPGQYGFLHLGLQEYLTALHAASRGEELFGALCAEHDDEWWDEVLLLLVGLPQRRLFGPLMERLLALLDLAAREDLLRACLDEAAEVDLGPLLGRLDPEDPPERLTVLLQLLRGRSDPRLLARVAPLAGHPHPAVAALARQIVEEVTRPALGGRPACDLLVVHHPEDAAAAGELVRRLRRAGLVIVVAGGGPSSRAVLGQAQDGARAVVVLAGPSGLPPWESKELLSILRLCSRRRQPLIPMRLPGAGKEAWKAPADLPLREWVDLRAGLAGAVEMLQLAIEKLLVTVELPAAEETAAEPGRHWVEPATGIRFLWIPGGRFRMGGDRYPDERPVHWVQVSPFWLGETPVTNRQYAVFLEQTGHEEPPFWRDRRFSAPKQSVVGVSWEDASAYCLWLSRTSGLAVKLPSEAQWEFAARGEDGREYPWGDAPPNTSRACFELDYEKGLPAPVGSYPGGQGPFGSLDQAGNVWEWCLDLWDEEAYWKRTAKGIEIVDPVVEGTGNGRVRRGGSWFSAPELLRSAYRLRFKGRLHEIVNGFRVTVTPASLEALIFRGSSLYKNRSDMRKPSCQEPAAQGGKP